MDNKVRSEYNGLEVEAYIIVGDWEGDPDVPNGINRLPDYIDDIRVYCYVKTAGGYRRTEITGMIDDAILDDIEQQIESEREPIED